jgi:hypothetical protein
MYPRRIVCAIQYNVGNLFIFLRYSCYVFVGNFVGKEGISFIKYRYNLHPFLLNFAGKEGISFIKDRYNLHPFFAEFCRFCYWLLISDFSDRDVTNFSDKGRAILICAIFC